MIICTFNKFPREYIMWKNVFLTTQGMLRKIKIIKYVILRKFYGIINNTNTIFYRIVDPF